MQGVCVASNDASVIHHVSMRLPEGKSSGCCSALEQQGIRLTFPCTWPSAEQRGAAKNKCRSPFLPCWIGALRWPWSIIGALHTTLAASFCKSLSDTMTTGFTHAHKHRSN